MISYRATKILITASILFFFLIINQRIFSQSLAEGKEKFLGAATSSYLWRYFDKYWNQITPGNDGKWGSVEPIRGVYNWTNLDKIYNFAVNRGLLFKEHTLVWGQQEPSWIKSLDTAQQRQAVENWIKAIGERYPKMALVDVVNEPFHAQPSYKEALGGNGSTGWDWVIRAFEFARKYCPPTAQLLLNEYNVLHDNLTTTNYIKLIELLKNRNLIDGIGIQGHYFEFRSETDATTNKYVYNINTIKSNLERLAATGLPIYITEFDIDEFNDQAQLEQYKIYFPIFWSHPQVKGITFWGYIQGDVWSAHPYTYLILSNNNERPAMQWLKQYVNTPIQPVLLSPIDSVNVFRNATLKWRKSLRAESYQVQVSKYNNFIRIEIDTLVQDTLINLKPLEENSTYYWRVKAINSFGESEFTAAVKFTTGDKILSIDDNFIKTEFHLYQNYPNPFNSSTVIRYSIDENVNVSLTIYDLLGRKIKTLVNEQKTPGTYSIIFDSLDLASGVYFYQLKAGYKISIRKLIIQK